MRVIYFFVSFCVTVGIFLGITLLVTVAVIAIIALIILNLHLETTNKLLYYAYFAIPVILSLLIPIKATLFLMKKLSKVLHQEINVTAASVLQASFNPFESTKKLILKAYPNEKIIQEKWALEWNLFMLGRISFIPVAWNLPQILPSLVRVMESEDRYFLDSRRTFLLNMLPNLIIALFVVFWIGFIIAREGLLFIIIAGMMFIIIMLWQQFHIRVIEKSWLEEEIKKGNKILLSGTIPPNAKSVLGDSIGGSVAFDFKKTLFLLR